MSITDVHPASIDAVDRREQLCDPSSRSFNKASPALKLKSREYSGTRYKSSLIETERIS